MNAAETDEELVVSVCSFQILAILLLFADAVYSLAIAIVSCKRMCEEVVTFQHLGASAPLAILALEGIIRVDVVHQLVTLQPRLFSPCLQVIIRTLITYQFVHQQGTNLIAILPFVSIVIDKTGISISVAKNIQGDIHLGAQGSIPALDALLVANEIIISTSSEQRQKRCCHQYMFCSHFA